MMRECPVLEFVQAPHAGVFGRGGGDVSDYQSISLEVASIGYNTTKRSFFYWDGSGYCHTTTREDLLKRLQAAIDFVRAQEKSFTKHPTDLQLTGGR